MKAAVVVWRRRGALKRGVAVVLESFEVYSAGWPISDAVFKSDYPHPSKSAGGEHAAWRIAG